jgi:hypothetical protein
MIAWPTLAALVWPRLLTKAAPSTRATWPTGSGKVLPKAGTSQTAANVQNARM